MLLLLEGAVSILVTIIIVSLLAGLVSALTGERFDPYNIQDGDDDITKLIKTENTIKMVSSFYQNNKYNNNTKR